MLMVNSKPIVSVAIVGDTICAIGNAIGAISVSVGDAVVSVYVSMLFLVTDSIVNGWIIIVITKVQPQTSRVDVAVAEEQKSREHRLGEHIEDTIEDGLGVW